MEKLKQTFNENKKKIIVLVLAIILGAVGVQLSQEQQDEIVNTIEKVVPDLPADEPVKP